MGGPAQLRAGPAAGLRLRAPRRRGFFWFAGQGGFGIQTAPAAARLAAALLLRHAMRRARSIPAPYSAARFALSVGGGAGQRVGALVLGMAAMALHPMPFDRCGAGASISSCQSSAFLTGFLSAVASRSSPAVDPLGDAVADIVAVGIELTRHGRFSASSPRIAASSSIRLLVVSGSPPRQFLLARARADHRRPSRPGPGLPLQAPSVNISTSVDVESRGFEARRQLEDHPLLDPFDRLLGHLELRGERVDHLADQQFRAPRRRR